MTIFNSLGSNYNFGFVLRSLFTTNDKKYHEQLKNFLEKKYHGKSVLVYKGREALRLALRIIDKKESTVAICGFTCFAVYDAIVKENYKVEYLDIEKNSLNFSFETLKRHVENNSQIQIVIIQNTLGNPCEIEKIAKFCKEKNIILIEDLAHSIGAVYKNSKEAGDFGDFIVLSFSQDKVIDGVSGGALIVKNSKFKIQSYELKKIPYKKQLTDRLYPLFTYKIRKTYEIGIGKALHLVLRKLRLLSNPMDNSDQIQNLPSWYCKLIYNGFINLDKNLNYRKKIANIYFEKLDKKVLKVDLNISQSTNIRFPILAENREKLIRHLKENKIFVSDIWYDAPIAPKKYLQKTNYMDQCSVSEDVSSKILNLPTHRNVSEKDAEYIVKTLNKWIISQ